MLKRIFVLTVVALFAAGVFFSAMAEEKNVCSVCSKDCGKNALQCAYNWFSSNMPMTCSKSAKTPKACMVCNKACCQTCQTNCGGNCCSVCGKK